ncbi:MAG: hypothetical protein WCI27_06825 [Candidatus Omnitrophota bacterium]
MLKGYKNKKAQNTAEYAILIALVIGGVIAMQMYAQRTLQGRLRDSNVLFRDSTNALGTTLQYEPYYTNKSETTEKDATKIDTYAAQQDTTDTRKLMTGYVDSTVYHNGTVNTNGMTTAETGAGF